MNQLDKVDPKFRLLADQLFFTDRVDLDTSGLKALLGNSDSHFAYLWDRITRSVEIFWDETFWVNRLDLMLSLGHKKLDEYLSNFLLSRFRRLVETRPYANPQNDNEYRQFIAWTKVRVDRKEDVMPIRDFFMGLVHNMQVSRIKSIIENFVPHLFQNMDEYLALLGKSVSHSHRNFEVLQQLEKQGVPIDRTPILKTAKNLLIKRSLNRPNRRSFFAMINDEPILKYLKSEYKAENRARLLELIEACEYKELEEYHFRNVKNLLELDSTIADELFAIYANSLYNRGYGNKKANIQRLIRLCKTHTQFSPKKVLVYLSSQNKMGDIKHLLAAFPELKPLIPFV